MSFQGASFHRRALALAPRFISETEEQLTRIFLNRAVTWLQSADFGCACCRLAPTSESVGESEQSQINSVCL